MSSELFADSAFWIALLNPRDSLHEKSIRLAEEHADTPLISTQEVLVEVLNFFSWRGPSLRQTAANLVEKLSDYPNILILEQSKDSFEAGRQLYANRKDKNYSLTDCISMATMRDRKIKEVLTSDDHFRQEGFNALLS